MDKKNKSNRKKISLGIIILIGVLAVGTVGFIIYQYNTVKAWSGQIYPGVKIEGEDLSGKTKEQAKKIVEEKYGVIIVKKKINIKTSDRTYTLDYSKINPKYNMDQIVNEAFAYGKDANLFKKYNIIKGSEKKQYTLKFTYDEKPIKELMDTIEKEVNKDPVDASLKGGGGNFTVVADKKGQKLQKDKLQKKLLAEVDGKIGQDINIQAPIEVTTAKIVGDKITVINTRIGGFSTNYGSISSSERANNIVLATRSINGKILMPSDSFSFNDVVGERTAQKGYQAAPIIIGNQVDSGLGGGICQVSTTLYNAVLRSNIKSTERSHHTLPSHYVPLGMDATVDFNNLDYKFKNTLSYPIYIEADASGGVISFNLYSDNSLAGIVTDISSQIYQTIQPGVKYEDDPNLPVGQTESVQSPYTGYKVKVTKITTQNGKVISQEQIGDDYYKPVDGVIKRGTKK